MSAIFDVFHVSQLKRCLCIPNEAIAPTNIKLQLDLTYEEKPIRVLEEMEREPRARSLSSTRWCGITTMNKMPRGNWRIIYMRFILLFMKNCRSFKSWDEISIRGRGCNTLVLSMHLALAFYEHKHHPSIHDHDHVKFHFIHLLFYHMWCCLYTYICLWSCVTNVRNGCEATKTPYTYLGW